MPTMGCDGGQTGGKPRLLTMTHEMRREVAAKAARARWAKQTPLRRFPTLASSSVRRASRQAAPGDRSGELSSESAWAFLDGLRTGSTRDVGIAEPLLPTVVSVLLR